MSKTDKKSIIISSKFFWYTRELIPHLEEILGLKTHIYKKNIFVKLERSVHVNFFKRMFQSIGYDYENIETYDKYALPQSFLFDFLLSPEIPIPEWNWAEISKNIKSLIELIIETKKDFPKITFIVQIFLAGIARNVRIIGNKEHPLKLFLDSIINYNSEIEYLLQLYQKWIITPEGNLWSLGTDLEDWNYLPYSLFIHFFRVPMENNKLIYNYLNKWLNHLARNNKTILVTDIPLLYPKRRRFPVIQCLTEEKDLEEIALYWKIFASLILRTLGYTATKISLIKDKQVSKSKMLLAIFNKKIQNNFEKYIDSCINPSVITTYKEYKKKFDQDFDYKRYSEFYSIYRGGILEKKYKKAETDLINNPRNKDTSRRVNRRKKYLIEFIIDFFDVFGYSTFEGIYLFKFFKSVEFNSSDNSYEFIKDRWIRKEKLLPAPIDSSDFPGIYLLDEKNNEGLSWILSAHKLHGFSDNKLIESIT